MFEIKPEDIAGTTNRLLYNIWRELIKLNEVKLNQVKPLCQPAGGIKEKLKAKQQVKQIRTCKICGEQFDNQGAFMTHMRWHKKEAANGS